MLNLSMNNFSSVANPSRIRLFCLIFSVLQHMFIISVNSYSPVEDFVINCGSSAESNSILGNRPWTGDIDSKHFSLIEPQKNKSSFTAAAPQLSDSVVHRVPYSTARLSYYEFTYSFPVTAGPKFIRLHFYPVSYPNFDRSHSLFSVKAGPYTLLKDFNASLVADENLHPQKIVLVEYCINVEPGQRLNVTFTPNPTHADDYAFINGIEVLSLLKYYLHCSKPNDPGFKLVYNKSLAVVREANINHGSLAPWPSPAGIFAKPFDNSSNNENTISAVSYGVIPVFILFSVIGFLCLWVLKIARAKGKTEIEMLSAEITKTKSIVPSGLCRYFSINEIRAATINFDDIFVVGVGGFGKVYKGYIDDGTTPVAIKRFIPNSGQGAHEFKTEVEMLSQLSHPQLVSLIGFCNEEDEMIIVYDFMANGTLRDHLYASANTPLSWKQRLEICIGAARGLQHLHNGPTHNIIHRDVKTSNILLDEKWVAKISDFGLSKIGPNGVSKFHVTTQVKGSLGYLDPEYSKTQRLTHKSDVYSFGVVLLEVLCGRPPLQRNMERPQRSLVEWAQTCHSEGPQATDQMVDPFLRGKIEPECLNKFVEMALNCVVHDGNQRPTMSDVVGGLELALQLQQSTEEDARFSGTQSPKNSTILEEG